MSSTLIKSRGFTIVEIVIVVAVTGLLLGIALIPFFNLFSVNMTSLGRTSQDTAVAAAARQIEDDLANAFSVSTNLTVASPLGAMNSTNWSYTASDPAKPNNRVLIATTYATTQPGAENTKALVFTAPAASGCGTASATPMQNALVYFAAKDPSNTTYNLYRRTLVNIGGGVQCATPTQRQSCAANVVKTNPIPCKSSDALLLRNIDSFTVDYYSSPSSLTPIVDQYLPTASTAVNSSKTIKITIKSDNMISGKKVVSVSTPRINLNNTAP